MATIRRNGPRRAAGKHTCVILGSFRKDQNLQKMHEVIAKFTESGLIHVVWPPVTEIRDKGTEFPRFLTDPPRATDKELEHRLLADLMENSCFVVLVNQYWDGRPYFGYDTAFEIGWARRAGKCVYPINAIAESPVIGNQVEGVKRPEEIIALVAKGHCPCGKKVSRRKVVARV